MRLLAGSGPQTSARASTSPLEVDMPSSASSTPSAVRSREGRMRARPGAAAEAVACARCERYPDRSCAVCAARRRRAVGLVMVEGLSVGEAARRMRLSIACVERLLEADADRRRVGALVQDEVATALLRELLADRRRREPTLTMAELARRMGSSQAQVERWLGLRATAPKTDRRGRTYPGRLRERVSVEVGGRLARAMGYAPCEV